MSFDCDTARRRFYSKDYGILIASNKNEQYNSIHSRKVIELFSCIFNEAAILISMPHNWTD